MNCNIALSLIVLRCQDIMATRHFYESLGLLFQQEQHGNGPTHYSSVLEGGLVLELYPATDGVSDNTRLGLFVPALDDAISRIRQRGITVGNRQSFGDHVFVVAQDPDGRKVEIVQQPGQMQLAA